MMQKISEWWSQVPRKRATLIGGLVVLVLAIVLVIVLIPQSQNPALSPYYSRDGQSTPVNTNTQFSETKPWIGVSSPHLNLGYDGVVMLSSLDEPYVQLIHIIFPMLIFNFIRPMR